MFQAFIGKSKVGDPQEKAKDAWKILSDKYNWITEDYLDWEASVREKSSIEDTCDMLWELAHDDDNNSADEVLNVLVPGVYIGDDLRTKTYKVKRV